MSLEGSFQKQWTSFLNNIDGAKRDEELFDICVANLVNERYEYDAMTLSCHLLY